MRDIYEIFNEINIEDDELIEIEVDELERKRVKKKLKYTINKRKSKQKYIIAASIISMFFLGGLYSYADNIPIVDDIFKLFSEDKEGFYDQYKNNSTKIGIIVEDKGTEIIINEGVFDGHNIDFLKNRVAFDLEWNSKDQTFDRDLLAMRTYFDCGLIDVGVIVTRAEELNEIFKQEKDENGQLLIKKYGASTTWMGKLIYRLDSRRNGGCPILAVGIRKECIEGYGRLNKYYNKLTAVYGREEI